MLLILFVRDLLTVVTGW